MAELQTINFYNNRKIITDHAFGLFNIELTNHCPMKCVMCPRTHNMTRDLGFMDPALFTKIIDELTRGNPSFYNNRVVWLHHFGESLLHPEFDFCIRYAAERGVRTGLSVNPMMLNEKTIRALLSSGLHILYLSLDGHNDKSFFKIRGIKNMYGMSQQKMINFLNLKKGNPCDMKIILSMIDFSLNDESLVVVKEKWESYEEIDGFLLKNYTTWDGAIPEIHAFARESAALEIRDSEIVTCKFPWENMTVTWDGDVVPCCFDYNKKLVLGNALSHSLSNIWNSMPMQNLRNEFIQNKVVNSLCKNCENLHT